MCRISALEGLSSQHDKDERQDTDQGETAPEINRRMKRMKFAQSHRHCPVDKSGCEKAEERNATSHLHGPTGPEKESRIDRATDGDHGHLRGGELVVESCFMEGR